MLTNDDLRKLADDVRGNGWLSRTDMYDEDTYLVDTLDGDALASAFNELLTLREAVAPQMAEVDAAKRDCLDLLAKIVLARGIEEEAKPPQPNPVPSYQELRERIDRLARFTFTSILACEREKQRADDAEAKGRKAGVTGIMHAMNAQCLTINQQEKQIESLTAQLSAIRDAGDEEVERLTNEIQYQLRTEDIIKLRDIAISRGQQRDEVVGLLKTMMGFTGVRNAVESVRDYRFHYHNVDAIRILEIVEGNHAD